MPGSPHGPEGLRVGLCSGTWLRFEYSQASGQHLRFTASATLIAGAPDDFFGRYDRLPEVDMTPVPAYSIKARFLERFEALSAFVR